MAKVSYVPYSEDFADFFTYCGITLAPSDFGGQQGWAADAFSDAAVRAIQYLDDNYDSIIAGGEYDEETIENLYDMFSDYPINYWSTEKPIYS